MNNIKKDFPLLENENITYLDSGATTQKPIQVIKAVEEFYQKYNANPHRGAYSLSVEATEQYENTRTKIAKFINARHREEIIFSKNATESLNLIAYSYGMDNLKKDDEVVISIMEHHSNLVPWQKVTKKTGSKLNYMYINDEFELTDEEIENKITDKTKIVGITHVSNVLGTINNVKKIIKYAHKKGAIVIVDASQSIPHMKIDVQDLDADFLVFSGHKMCAPLGIGVLYGKKEILNKMSPFLMGGDMIEYVYEQDTTFAPLPNKFEAGTQNVEGVIGLGSAIDYIENLGYDKIQKIEKEILKDSIMGIINDKGTYAMKQASEIMFEGEPYAISGKGYIEDLDDINGVNLYQHYKNILKTSPIEIIIEGEFDESEVVELIKERFTFDRGDIIDLPKEEFYKEVDEVKEVKETMDIAQGKLVMGYRCNVDYLDEERYYSLLLGSRILGGGADSKLFVNVREKESLCYTIYSTIQKSKSTMMVCSGIEAENYERTVELVKEQVQKLKDGDITETEIANAKIAFINSLNSLNDEIGRLSDFYFSQSIAKNKSDLDEIKNMINKSTKEDVVDAVKDIQLDTIYFLSK